jgi:peptidoglycan/xylan/chitin deacetylase (PgdA/CDA1 family)
MLLKAALGMASPAGSEGRLSVLIFHRVLERPDPRRPSLPDRVQFDRQLCWLKSYFNVLPLSDAVERLRQGSLPARAAAITFDDGYADNVSCALPVLRSHGLHATFFIATGYLDGGVMWNDVLSHAVYETQAVELDCTAVGLGRMPLPDNAARVALVWKINAAIKHLPFDERARAVEALAAAAGVEPQRTLMMSSDQLRELHRAGMGIGGHTVDHPILARCTAEQARTEIATGRRQLQELVGDPIDLFAYPNGKPGDDYLPGHVDLVRELGFKAAFSTTPGASNRHSDLFQIRRFMPWDRSRARFGLRMLQNLWAARQERPATPTLSPAR